MVKWRFRRVVRQEVAFVSVMRNDTRGDWRSYAMRATTDQNVDAVMVRGQWLAVPSDMPWKEAAKLAWYLGEGGHLYA